MKPKETYFYELLIIDEAEKTDITSVKSLLMALSYSDRLWKKPQLKNSTIVDNTLSVSLDASIIQSSKSNEIAFKLLIESSNQMKLETFINSLVQHVKKKLLFSSIQIIKDGVAAAIVKKVEPLIEEADKIINDYLAKHETIKDVDWLVESSKELSEAKKIVESVRKVLAAITNEQGIKNKPLKVANKSSEPKNKTNEIPTLVLKKDIEAPKNSEIQEEIKKPTHVEVVEQKPVIIDVKPIEVANEVNSEPERIVKKDYSSEAFKMITEKELLEELKIAESTSNSFIDLKEFVNQVLAPKGFASGPTFSLARMMSGKGLVEIYDTKDATGMPVKAVKIQ